MATLKPKIAKELACLPTLFANPQNKINFVLK